MNRIAALASAVLLASLPGRAAAQQPCGVTATGRHWPSPLDRRIALRARDVSLREALDRVAAAARFRVSYSAEFLPLDRHVCVHAEAIVAGDALAGLLAGVSVSPVVTGADQVVIAPTRPSAAPTESVQTLERVVVTGSASGNAQRPLTVALDVIDRRQVEGQASGSLAASFDGSVAGLWLWEQSPASLLASYGSIRGASSFGVSYPKVYIDGIEVANPLLVTDLSASSIERIEVIRGPQGAALYGADAISGVVNIITRHEGLQSGASRTEVISSAGASQTAYPTGRSVLAQNHSINWRAGSSVRSGSLGLTVTTLGGYVPDAYSRDVKLNGGFKIVTPSASITGTGRVYAKRAAAGENPLINGLLATASVSPGAPTALQDAAGGAGRAAAAVSREDSLADIAQLGSLPQTIKQYTFGTTSTLLSGTRWMPSFSAGIDGYRLSNVSVDQQIIPSALDSALRSAVGGADRVSFRASMVGRFDLARAGSLTLTFSGEHSLLQEITTHAPAGQDPESVASVRTNSGLVAQANVALRDALYVTGGARLENNNGYTASAQTELLPMVGLAAVRDLGRLTVKGRAAYGVGVRPVRSAARLTSYSASTSLDPERQSGIEVGADVFYGGFLEAHVTRFDQTASGLIQSVAVSRLMNHELASAGTGSVGDIGYVLQNVGEITNRGWEVETSVNLRRLTLGAAYSAVNSRVRHIAENYQGDLREGDRMLAVPAGTAALSASWSLYGWRAGMVASRAFDWINYDRLKLASDYASCVICISESVTGPRLRTYWKAYDGVTRLRASLSRELPRGLGLQLAGDNLTNAQRGEPDNITVLPGRTFMFGLSAKIP
jgi:iron complex outermembrane receptor protein